MNRYFKTPGGILILSVVIGLSLLFGAGIWYMIAVGLLPALGVIGAYLLAWVVAPLVAILSIVMFTHGEQLKNYILDYEHVYGKHAKLDEQGEVLYYFNKPSAGWIITSMKGFVFVMDSAGITYRILMEPITLEGKALLWLVLELLALSPWLIGIVVYMVANRPAGAIRRDVEYLREITAAESEMDTLTQSQKKGAALPAHMRKLLPAPKRETPVFTPALVTEESQSQQSQNGKRPLPEMKN